MILALSNPTDHAECTAEQAYTWSKGKVIYAAGVQFPPVHLNGQTFLPGQANNFYIFPAIGLAIYATQAKRVPDEMFIEAAAAVADQVPPNLFKQSLIYPLQSNIGSSADLMTTGLAISYKGRYGQNPFTSRLSSSWLRKPYYFRYSGSPGC